MEKELQEQLKDILSGYEVPSERLLNEPINLYDKVITFINQNFIGKEALREKIEKTQGDCIKDPFDNEHEFLSKAKLLELLK